MSIAPLEAAPPVAQLPLFDGYRPDILKITFGGAVDLDLYDEQATAFITGLKLGQELQLTITARVASKTDKHSLKGDNDEDHLVHAVSLTAHTIDLPNIA